MISDEIYETDYNKKELKVLSQKPHNIQIDALKTKQAYDKAYAEKGIAATSKRDYPRTGQGYRAIERLLQFDSIVDAKKGITKVIHSMIVQPMTIGNQKKYALYMHGSYVGYDAWDSEIGSAFSEGFHYKPKLQFTPIDIMQPFDPKTGERRGTYKPVGYSMVHDIFVPSEPKERRKFLEKFTKELDMSNCQFIYRRQNHDNNHASTHSQISWNNLCDLTFTQLEELSTKKYYKEANGALKDKDGVRVQYDPSTKKVESMEGR